MTLPSPLHRLVQQGKVALLVKGLDVEIAVEFVMLEQRRQRSVHVSGS